MSLGRDASHPLGTEGADAGGNRSNHARFAVHHSRAALDDNRGAIATKSSANAVGVSCVTAKPPPYAYRYVATRIVFLQPSVELLGLVGPSKGDFNLYG